MESVIVYDFSEVAMDKLSGLTVELQDLLEQLQGLLGGVQRLVYLSFFSMLIVISLLVVVVVLKK